MCLNHLQDKTKDSEKSLFNTNYEKLQGKHFQRVSYPELPTKCIY